VFTQALESGPGRVFGAFHGLDVLFLFQQLTLGGYQPSADERAVAGAFAGYWTNLAATGDPNGAGLPAWPRYDARTDPYLHLGTPVEARAGYRGDRCDLWDRLRGEATASLSQASGGW
jgi:para-nitrobenzyl esterase